MSRACNACGQVHLNPMNRCEVDRAQREHAERVANAGCSSRELVANGSAVVANAVPVEVPVGEVKESRHGEYADVVKRGTYMRGLMRRRRAEGKA